MATKKKPTPRKNNPGAGTEAQVAFSNGERTWTENVNLVDGAAATLRERGYTVEALVVSREPASWRS
ncbi:MAG: hypothetical protein FJ303_03035 [Planctomycetes bacterium]|nr:hypothetical protein [Planctomycetota bacterium]